MCLRYNMLSSVIKLVFSVSVVGFIPALKREAFSLTFRKSDTDR